MAWLVAFNDGLFDDIEPDAIPPMLDNLTEAVSSSRLRLDTPREEWASTLSEWFSGQDFEKVEQ
jgi:F-type H+-transporting ATPase subunit alpha